MLRRSPGFAVAAIGLRLAMGAQPRDMVRMVVGGALGLAGAGVAAGLLATLLASRALVSLLFEVSPTDLTTLAGVSLVLLLVAAAAAGVPARRAAAWTLSPLYVSSSSLASSSSAAQ